MLQYTEEVQQWMNKNGKGVKIQVCGEPFVKYQYDGLNGMEAKYIYWQKGTTDTVYCRVEVWYNCRGYRRNELLVYKGPANMIDDLPHGRGQLYTPLTDGTIGVCNGKFVHQTSKAKSARK